jgi:hypothetical protein
LSKYDLSRLESRTVLLIYFQVCGFRTPHCAIDVSGIESRLGMIWKKRTRRMILGREDNERYKRKP